MDFERGPRYDEYAKLREKKLRFNYQQYQQQDYQEQQQQEKENVFESKIPTISTKQAKFQVGVASVRKGSSSLVAQSVPDFSSLLRKENRKPVNTNMQPTTLTPPLNKNKGCGGVMSSSRGGSRSVNAEKRKGYGGGGGGGILTARKSYGGNFDELRSFSSATANAINGESRNGRVVGKKNVLR